MGKQWSVREIVASLETQAEVHRERAAFHARHEAEHREQRTLHEAELAAISERLELFRSAASAAVELAVRVPEPLREVLAEEDFGPASKPHLTRMVEKVLADVPPRTHVGPGWVAQEVNRRFGENLRRQVDDRQISDVLRRLCRDGKLYCLRRGRPHHEARYTRERQS